MTDLSDLLVYFGAFLFVIALIGIGGYVLKGILSGGSSQGGGLLRGRERRLGVVEAAAVDGRRKLILLRRDNIEHLIMTGGPVDMLIESGIDRSDGDEPESDATSTIPARAKADDTEADHSD